MPPILPLQAQTTKLLAEAYFMTLKVKLPHKWVNFKLVKGADHAALYSHDQHDYGFGCLISGLPTAIAPKPYIFASSSHQLHADSAEEIGKLCKEFVEAVIDDYAMAVDLGFRLQAKFKDLKVNALTALGTPGCLDGPEIKGQGGWPKCAALKFANEDNGKAYIKAAKEGLSKNFKDWADKVIVPGLPWYPAFVAFPLATAPPMPNIPMPLICCPSANMAKMITPSQLKDSMVKELSKGVKKKDKPKIHEAVFDTIGTVLALNFILWLVQQQVMLVMGKGPIPTYAPPYVPVGPVVMGDNIATPGHLMA